MVVETKGAPGLAGEPLIYRGVPRNTYLARLLILSNGQPPFQRPSRSCQQPPPVSPNLIITIWVKPIGMASWDLSGHSHCVPWLCFSGGTARQRP